MATQTQATKWKSIIRRVLVRPSPYWRTRLEDEQEALALPILAAVRQVVAQILFAVLLALAVLMPTAYISMLVFVVPGGLPQIVGSQLADVCRTTGNCDIHYLLAGYAFAVNFAIVASVFLVVTIVRATSIGDNAPSTDQDLAFIDERIVGLRNELVMAGIITVPKEERTDQE
jgi:hypothetical protein